MDLLDVFCTVSIKDEYSSGIDSASKSVSSFADKLKSGLATAAKIGTAAVTTVTAAASALSGAVIKQTGEVAAYGDNIDKMSQKMGLSAEAYQEWDAVMQHSGTSIESLQAGMKTLANAVESGNGAFKRLGITQEQIAGMDNEDLFSATITALQNVDNETERTYLAGQLLGRGATELGALLNTSAEDTQAMKDRVHELGGVMSNEAVKAAAAYQDSLQDMQTAFSGLSRGMTSEFLPSITTVMDGLTEIFSGNGDAGITMVSEGLSGFVESITEALPRVLDAGGQIISSLLGVVMENAPALIESGADLVGKLVVGITQQLPELVGSVPEIISSVVSAISDGLPDILAAGSELLDMLTTGILDAIPAMLEGLPNVITAIFDFLAENGPTFIESGADFIGNLLSGIIDAIPDMVAKLPEVITSITGFFTENFPAILEKGGELLGQLIAGILGAIPEIAKSLPDVITAIVDALRSGWEELKNAGKYLLEGLWSGISEKVEWLKRKVTGAIDTVVGGVKNFLGIKSPSKVFASIGGFMAEGLGEGWEDEYKGIKRRIEDGMDFGTATVDFSSTDIGKTSGALRSAFSDLTASMSQNATIIVQSVLDGKIIGETAYQYSQNRQRAYGV